MKVAFVGTEGSGKTTLSALFIRFLAGRGLPVMAIDGDVTQRLAEALDVGRRPAALSAHLLEIKEYLRGTNPRIASADAMVETTPPGRGSWLLRFGGADPVHDLAIGTPCGARLLVTGPRHDDLTTGVVGLYLNHLVDGPHEYVVADCAEESDKFDLIFVVTEPTGTGVSVYRRWASYAMAHGISIALVANKIGNDQDLAFLREQTGADPLAWFALGSDPATEPMDLLAAAVDECEKDWFAFSRRAARSHASFARSDRAAVRALLAQIDPGFTVPAPQRSLSR
jgi:CO dehydrogenase maturation factor